MVKTGKALLAAGGSAIIIGGVHYVSHKFIFNNPALMDSNIMLVGVTVTVATFIVGFVGMKWKDWTK